MSFGSDDAGADNGRRDRAHDDDHTGRLLVASPKLGDPNFERSVIVVLDHGEEGALGIVINRPTGLPVEEVLEPWHDQARMAPPGVVFAGGPVSREAVIGVARSRHGFAGVADAGWRPVLAELGTVDLSVPPEDQPIPLAGARLFSGYAGWGPGQLEEEMNEGAWYSLETDPDDLLCEEPELLWHDVLRRQGGRLAMMASYPPHPSVN
jgi:putative transcriptional regulator